MWWKIKQLHGRSRVRGDISFYWWTIVPLKLTLRRMRVQSNVFFFTDEEFNEWIRTDDGLETTKETTDDKILERVMSEMHGNETVDVDEDDEDDEEISVSDLVAKSAIETRKKYLRQKEDCTSDIGSMKLGKIDLFVNTKTLNSVKQSTLDRFFNKE